MAARRGFMDVYDRPDRRYNPQVEGYGHAGKWRQAFRQRMSLDEARETLNEESPYTILGVKTTAAWSEIKTAYRRLACKWHPDVCKLPGAEETMKKINAAFTILEERFGKA